MPIARSKNWLDHKSNSHIKVVIKNFRQNKKDYIHMMDTRIVEPAAVSLPWKQQQLHEVSLLKSVPSINDEQQWYLGNRIILKLQCISIHKPFSGSQVHPPGRKQQNWKLVIFTSLSRANTQRLCFTHRLLVSTSLNLSIDLNLFINTKNKGRLLSNTNQKMMLSKWLIVKSFKYNQHSSTEFHFRRNKQ